jgi:hypothetical protein
LATDFGLRQELVEVQIDRQTTLRKPSRVFPGDVESVDSGACAAILQGAWLAA